MTEETPKPKIIVRPNADLWDAYVEGKEHEGLIATAINPGLALGRLLTALLMLNLLPYTYEKVEPKVVTVE